MLGEELDTCEDRQEEEGVAKGAETDPPTRDVHLKEYDEEIFDDDDFYHQVHETVFH